MTEQNDPIIVITTCDRQALGGPSYLQGTLESMFESPRARQAPVVFVVDGDDFSYLRPLISRFWGDKPEQNHHPVGVLHAAHRGKPKERVTQNFAAALSVGRWPTELDVFGPGPSREAMLALFTAAPRPLVVLQDDLIFAASWYEKLVELTTSPDWSRISHVRRSPWPKDYVLTLYASARFKRQPVSDEYRASRFYGNQALYMPPTTADGLAAFLRSQIAAGSTEIDDMLVKHYLERGHAKLFVCNPNLVQHVGVQSAIDAGQRHHQSPTFVRR